MPCVDVVVECPVYDSFRVQQVAGMFDVPLAERATQSFHVDVPDASDEWQVGLIVGPSGSGKSTVAAKCFGEHLYQGQAWPTDRAVVDCFGELPMKQITGLLTAVGFSSPPSWIKPYSVLSQGERFRCDLARALSVIASDPNDQPKGVPDDRPVVAFDEFTSVVDRNVARVCAAAISKGIRRDHIRCRFVAITCHYDVARWLEPDWIVDMATQTLDRRRLRRPRIKLEIFRCRRRAWVMFAQHHYLSGSLAPAARCFVALWKGVPVAFCATLPVIGRRDHRRFTRIVTLPDYQGIGIGMRMVEAVASLHREEGHRINVTSSHPALINHSRRSEHWRVVNVKKTGSRGPGQFIKGYRSSAGRSVVSLEYVGSQLRRRSQ